MGDLSVILPPPPCAQMGLVSSDGKMTIVTNPHRAMTNVAEVNLMMSFAIVLNRVSSFRCCFLPTIRQSYLLSTTTHSHNESNNSMTGFLLLVGKTGRDRCVPPVLYCIFYFYL